MIKAFIKFPIKKYPILKHLFATALSFAKNLIKMFHFSEKRIQQSLFLMHYMDSKLSSKRYSEK